MLKAAVVGIGAVSGAHVPAWQSMPNVELVAICDIRTECMDTYDNVRKYTDLNTMLEKEEVDILDICLPTFLHVETAIKAMKRGIHVICEKPISLNKVDVARVYATAEQYNVKFMVAQVLRFWPEYNVIRSVYESGKYGKLLSGCMTRLGGIPTWTWNDWMRDESLSGLVPFDLHIHDLDFMIYAFGKPNNIHTFRSKQADQDYVHAVYEYDGFHIQADAAWYASPYPFRAQFRFQFEDAVIACEDGGLTIYERNGTITKASEADTDPVIAVPKSDAYADELKYFVDCVENDRPIEIIRPKELETVLDILNAM